MTYKKYKFIHNTKYYFISNIRHMHPKKLKGLSLGFQFFGYLSFEFEFEYFANLLQISNKNI